MSETNSEIVWYIAREGQQHGPLTDAEMRLFVQSGHLKPTDLVWNQTMTEWQSAEAVFPEAAKPPQQPVPPPPPPHTEAASAPKSGAGEDAASSGAAPRVSSPSPSQREPDVSPAAGAAAGAAVGAAATSYEPAGKAVEAGALTSDSGPTANLSARSPAAASPHGDTGYVQPAARQPEYARTNGEAAGAARSQRLPSPDEVLPTFRQEDRQRSRMQSDAAHVDMGRQQPAPVDGEDEDYDDAPRKGRFGLAAGLVLVAAVAIGGGVLAVQNKDAIFKYMNEKAGTAEVKPPPVIKADKETKTAALDVKKSPPDKMVRNDQTPPAKPAATMPTGPELNGITVTIPPTQPATGPQESAADSVPLQTIDKNLQKSQLWRVVKAEFPKWYEERVKEISQLSNSASETDLSKHLIGKLVALRRENAKYALSASTEDLQSIAEAFLANLKSLAGHSTEACYTFISKGETSPSVIALFPKPGYGDAIEGQIAAVFRAVASGRKSPVTRDKASKADYDALAAELTKLGWSKADLGLFANPQALAKAPPEKVCKMVQDWFTAHVSIPDKAVQDRLLVETLRPVVAG